MANTYTDVLGRIPSASEVAYWQNAINNGMTPQQVAEGFINSPERLNTLINNLYTQYLGRTADQQGLQYWTSVWLANGGPEQVQAGIIGSIEFFETAAAQNPNLAADAAWVTAAATEHGTASLRAQPVVNSKESAIASNSSANSSASIRTGVAHVITATVSGRAGMKYCTTDASSKAVGVSALYSRSFGGPEPS